MGERERRGQGKSTTKAPAVRQNDTQTIPNLESKVRVWATGGFQAQGEGSARGQLHVNPRGQALLFCGKVIRTSVQHASQGQEQAPSACTNTSKVQGRGERPVSEVRWGAGGRKEKKKEEEVVVDKKSYLYLLGTTLDFSGGLNGKGFVFQNPNADRTCGCGESFSV